MEVKVSNSSDQSRVLDLYTKSGDLDTYSSMVVLDVDHNIGFVILSAGEAPSTMARVIADLVARTFIPAFEGAARENAMEKYVGAYAANSKSNVTFAVDDRPGLALKSWFSSGVDVFKSIAALKGYDSRKPLSIRLYPSGLSTASQIGFRAVIELLPKASDRGIINSNCETWMMAEGGLLYGRVALDDFVVDVDTDGKATAVEPRSLREKLVRV
jgi:hypothetical protein